MKILFVTSEAAPFIRSGGLGDVAGALPKEMKKLGHDIRVIVPYYKKEIKDCYSNLFKMVGSTFTELGWRKQYCGIFETEYDGITYYFVDNEYYFSRPGLYGHFDDGERFAFFSKAVLDALQVVDFYPDILHANDWQCALAPVFLDVFYRSIKQYENIRTAFTIHNIEFQGKFDGSVARDILGLPDWAVGIVENEGCTNFMKGGIEASSVVTTVSETYANEILDPFYSYGLESILSERSFKIKGVVNGIDTDLYNPKTDANLFAHFTAKSVAKKEVNKVELLKMLNMPYSKTRPLMSMVTRLTEQKGMELFKLVIDDIMRADIQVVVLGTGDYKYEELIKDIELRYPGKFKAILAFSSDLASKIYSASDMFLMPSKFEPCGLSQMIAMRYGTVPIVRETGGLKDTVLPFNQETGDGLGFTFKTYNAYDMLDAVWRAYACYHDSDKWAQVVANDMGQDFSWKKSAKKYIDIYKNIN